MKKKKGFTLIELLAVIVILAIIMVIAVPKILDLIEESKENATASSIKLLKDAIKTQVASSQTLSNNTFATDINGCYEFNFDNDDNNVEKLTVKNKEHFTGKTTYCDGSFTDSDLTFDGNTVTTEKRYYLYNKGVNNGIDDRESSTSCYTTHYYYFNTDNLTVDYADQSGGCTGWAEIYSTSSDIDMSKYTKAVVEFKSIIITDEGKAALFISNNYNEYNWLTSSGENVKLELDLSENNEVGQLRLAFTTKPSSVGLDNFSYGHIDQYKGNVRAVISAIYFVEK